MGIATNLYPPVVDTYMPAFIADSPGECRIYFSLSKYNSLDSIKSVWVAVNNQFTNESVVFSGEGKNQIGVKPFAKIETDNSRTGDDKYYISLYNEDIIGGWALNQLYKVQIRFSDLAIPDDSTLTMSWITQNESKFSEWSTVCLIQGILKPQVYINKFDDSEAGSEVIFSSIDNTIAGQVKFEDEEQLESYVIKFYKQLDTENCLYDSGTIYTNEYNPNEINYFVKYAFEEGEQYRMEFTYTTQSLYTETRNYDFSIISVGGEMLNAKITAEQDEQEGRIIVRVTSDVDRFFGNLTIRRSSSETGFTLWEDVHTTEVRSEGFLDFTWYDYTVESGIFYKYCVQKRNSYGDRGLIIPIKEPVMVTLQDMFLTRAGQQLKIKFNPQISSFKRTVSESLTQTLGSKYPFIKRNSNVGYRQFSISGLISHFSDEEELFCSKDELYRQSKDLYLTYNDENRINEYNDFSLEKTFREKVQDFLYEHNVKLFRSPSEGNILVKLMDINFTPERTLGRMVYSFSATAYEIDEINFTNFEKYGIQEVGTYSKRVFHTYKRTGQNHLTISEWGNSPVEDFKAIIQQEENDTLTKGLKKDVKNFTWLDIQFESKPYLINTEGAVPSIVQAGQTTSSTTVLGYLIQVNGETIIVNRSGSYSLKGEEVSINSFEIYRNPNENIQVIVDFECVVEEGENQDKAVKQVSYYSRAGQLYGWYKPINSIAEMIHDKYDFYYDTWYQRLFAINSIAIEAEPNTIFYIKDTSSDAYKRYQIGQTGYLKIIDEDFSIDGIYCLGIHLMEKPKITVKDNNKQEVEIYQYQRTKDFEYEDLFTTHYYNNINEIRNPVKNGVYCVKNVDDIPFVQEGYSLDNNYFSQLQTMLTPSEDLGTKDKLYRVIYYKDNWYLFSRTDDVIMPCQALVDYYYEFEKGEYNKNV